MISLPGHGLRPPLQTEAQHIANAGHGCTRRWLVTLGVLPLAETRKRRTLTRALGRPQRSCGASLRPTRGPTGSKSYSQQKQKRPIFFSLLPQNEALRRIEQELRAALARATASHQVRGVVPEEATKVWCRRRLLKRRWG